MQNFNTKFKSTIIVGLLLIAGAGVLIWNYAEDKKGSAFQFNPASQTAAVVMGESYIKFTHPDYLFSVEYPEELKIERFQEENNSETIVFQDINNANLALEEKIGFQIFISPFEEDKILTKERILEDLPYAIIEDQIEVVLGDDTRALLFWSDDPMIGKTREIWFIGGGNLYEITTYAHLDTWLAGILSTWSFNTL